VAKQTGKKEQRDYDKVKEGKKKERKISECFERARMKKQELNDYKTRCE
jgi:hypothetical protein